MKRGKLRISEASRQTLQELSKIKKVSVQAVLEQAIESYRRQSFLEGLHSDFAKLNENESEWEREKAERSIWDNAATEALHETEYLLRSPENARRLLGTIAELDSWEKDSN